MGIAPQVDCAFRKSDFENIDLHSSPIEGFKRSLLFLKALYISFPKHIRFYLQMRPKTHQVSNTRCGGLATLWWV